ncbi:MAG: lipopolysaccharide heptosyltransferase I [Gammaproteobacteria bacterium]
MQALLVKLTSMGDLIHALPAITDAARHIPGLTFDWVIEKNFAEIATWHPAIRRIIPTSHRRWRRQWWQQTSLGEMRQFMKALREQRYDKVIDGQNSLKSALVMFMARGPRYGMDKKSSREWIAHLAHQNAYFVNTHLHAILRLRLLFAQVFGYDYQDSPPDFGINQYTFPALPVEIAKPYVVFIHNASWSSKLWPESYWRTLAETTQQAGLSVVLPWGNAAEKQRALTIAKDLSHVHVLPFCSLSQLARVLIDSVGAVGGDTGLGHLAAALKVPSISLYGSTRKDLIGTLGEDQHHIVSPFLCINCHRKQCNYQSQLHDEPLCMQAIFPQQVWQQMQTILTC